MKVIEKLRLESAIEKIEATGYPAFTTDIKKDEVENNPSFFIFEKDGKISRAETSSSQYIREFVLSFITRENAKIDEIELIESLRGTGLSFRGSETDYGKMATTDEEAKMITLIFTRVVKVC